jgi:hypothetical protein
MAATIDHPPYGRRAAAAIAGLCVLLHSAEPVAAADPLFADDFEGDLAKWELIGEQAVRIRDSADPTHGRVLELTPHGVVLALIPGSETWGPVRITGSFLFPEPRSGYFGLVYNYRRDERRADWGSVYVKNDGSYIRANPFRDGNASRLLYEERRVSLPEEDRIRAREWYPFEAEIVGRECHLYVGDRAVPDQTFALFEYDSGKIGFQPRVVGTPVWIDDVRVESIEELRYAGPPVPEVSYSRDALLTDWEVLGPFPSPRDDLERGAEVTGWRPFETDPRGAVITGRVTEYHGDRPVAYFRTVVHSDTARDAVLHFSTADELALWVDDVFHGFVYRNGYMQDDPDWNAWHDFASNPEHAGRSVPVRLDAGDSTVLIRVRAGQFASGGFFARLD